MKTDLLLNKGTGNCYSQFYFYEPKQGSIINIFMSEKLKK